MNNTITRSISGVGFIAIIVAGLMINKFCFAALVSFMMVVMMAEFYKMNLGSRFHFSRILAILSGEIFFILMFLRSAYDIPLGYVSIAILPIFIVMINSLYMSDKSNFWRFSHIYTGLLYIAFPLALSNLVVFNNHQFNGLLMLCFFIIIWASDVGAYIFGITLGQKFGKKLCPSISPKKSWIGFWGGMLMAVIASIILKYIGFLNFPLIHCVVLALLMDVFGVYGDLFESQWKRCYDIKDSGSLIPGHGGFLDRFDSTLFAIPVGVIYLVVLNLL